MNTTTGDPVASGRDEGARASRRARRPLRAAALGGVGLVLVGCGGGAPDTLFVDAHIYTLAGNPPARVEDEPWVEALAVRDGRVVAAGSDEAMRRLAGRETRIHTLGGATVVPGLVDCHVHLQSLGRSLREVDLVGTSSYEEVVQRVRDRAATLAPGAWITGRGWDQNDWPITQFPDHALLSAATADHPVYLRRVDGHAALVNARALEIAGIDAGTSDPSGGRIERRADGSPSGVLVDAACELVRRRIPVPTADERRLRLRLALAHCVSQGLTGVHDAGETRDDAADERALLAAGELPLRVYAMWDAMPDTDDPGAAAAALRAGPQPFDSTMHLAFRTVKMMVDGALGSRGAALLTPYSDAPDHSGLPRYDLEQFLALARPFHAAGFQLATHAIGDAGNRLVLDAYGQLQRETPRPDARHRVEHAQILAPEDMPRFAQLGVLPSMQPTHCTSDMPWAGERLGSERLAGAYAWRSLRETGVVIPAGSDAPVESVAPLLGIYAAVTRQDLQGNPSGGWAPEQRLTRSETLRAFSSWAAWASFAESDLGTLEPGKLADFTVLDRDIMTIAAGAIPGTHVLQTIVGGTVVYDAAHVPTASPKP